MSAPAALASRSWVLLWLALGTVFLLGRVALMFADSTLDLRYPALFELTVLPPIQAAGLLWLGRRLDPHTLRQALFDNLALKGPRRALIGGVLAAVAFAVLRWRGSPGAAIERDSRIVFGVFALAAAVAAMARLGRASTRAARGDWGLAAGLAAVVASNAALGWLDRLAIEALPTGVGAVVARGALVLAGVALLTTLALRVEAHLSRRAAGLLWTGEWLLLAAIALRFLLWLLGYPVEPWTSLARALAICGAAALLAALLGDWSRAAAVPAAPTAPVGFIRTWLVLALLHLAVSSTITLALFPGWRLGWTTPASWLAVTALQAGAARVVHRLEVPASVG